MSFEYLDAAGFRPRASAMVLVKQAWFPQHRPKKIRTLVISFQNVLITSIKNVLMGIPKRGLLGIAMAVIHAVGQ